MMIFKITYMITVFFLFSCSQTMFSSSAGERANGTQNGPRTQGNGSGSDGMADAGDADASENGDFADGKDLPSGGGASEDDDESGEIELDEEDIDCEDEDEKIDDADGMYNFATMNEIIQFVNGKCKTGISTRFENAGAVGSDIDTVTAVCNLKGYQSPTVLSTGAYSSPHDNFIAYWDKNQSKFILAGAKGRNSRVQGLDCTGTFKRACFDEDEEIDCEF